MSLHRIRARLLNEPWAILPSKHAAMHAALVAHESGVTNVAIAAESIPAPESQRIVGGVAVIPIHGIIGKHLSAMETMCGGYSLDKLSDDLDAAAEEDMIHSVVLDIRSPGGGVVGLPEAAAEISELAAHKTVVAYIDEIGASAAYWLASQATRVAAAPSAEVGSIGVYAYHLDRTRQFEQEGVKVNEFTSGKYKTMGAEYKPLTQEEGSMLQARVDKIFGQFKEAVTAKRHIDERSMQGQLFDGEEAVDYGLVDELYASLDDVVASLVMGKVG